MHIFCGQNQLEHQFPKAFEQKQQKSTFQFCQYIDAAIPRKSLQQKIMFWAEFRKNQNVLNEL